MSFGEYALGALLFVVVYGSVIAAAVLLQRRIHPALAGAERWLAWAILGTGLLIGVHLLPGLFGILSRWSVAVVALLVLAVALALRGERGERDQAPPPAAPSDDNAASWWLAALGVAMVVVYVLAYVRAQRTVSPNGVDMMSFHMPDVARWIQRGTFWQEPELVPDWAQGAYPHNPEVVLLSVVLPWRNDAFVRFIYFPYLALFALGVYALARRLAVPRPLAALAGALVVSPPVVVRTTLETTKPDLVLWAMFAAALVFLIRHWTSGARSDLALAGLGLGLAFGSKWSGFAAVVALLVAWGITWLVARRPVAAGIRVLVRMIGWIALGGGFWLVRNAVLSGNPLFANKIAFLGVTIFDAPPDPIKERLGFSILHYAGQPGILRSDILPPLWRAGRLTLGLAVAGVIAALVLALVRRPQREPNGMRGLVLAGVGTTLLLFLAYTATPLSAYGPRGAPDPLLTLVSVRYGVPALITALPLAAWAASRLQPRYRTVVEVVVVAAIAYCLHESVPVAAKDIVVTAVACGAVLVIARFALKMPRRLVPAAAVALAFVLLLGGYAQQKQANDRRFSGDAAITAVQTYAPAGYRIGVAGQPALSRTVPVYAMFGPRLRNDVQWIGPLVRGVLRNWPDAQGFRRAVRQSRFDLIMIERGAPPKPSVREQAWLAGLGYRQVARSTALTLYRRVG